MQKKTFFLIILLIVIIGTISKLACAAENIGNKAMYNNKEPFEFIGKIEKIEALSSGETITRKRWQIDVTIVKIISNKNNVDIKNGDKIYILVHSVVKTFKKDRSDLIGAEYIFKYNDKFEKIYSGQFETKSK